MPRPEQQEAEAQLMGYNALGYNAACTVCGSIEPHAPHHVVGATVPGDKVVDVEAGGIAFPEDEGPDGKWTSGNDTAARSFEVLVNDVVEFMRSRFEVLQRKDQLIARQDRELQDNKRNFEEHVAKKLEWLRGKDQPNLGLATNKQLVQELATRYEMGRWTPDYRTVNPEEDKTNE